MAGTKLGGQKAAVTNKAKFGDNFYKEIGALGGANGRGHAFAHGKVDPHAAGKAGGLHIKLKYETEHHKLSARKLLSKLARRPI